MIRLNSGRIWIPPLAPLPGLFLLPFPEPVPAEAPGAATPSRKAASADEESAAQANLACAPAAQFETSISTSPLRARAPHTVRNMMDRQFTQPPQLAPFLPPELHPRASQAESLGAFHAALRRLVRRRCATALEGARSRSITRTTRAGAGFFSASRQPNAGSTALAKLDGIS